MKKETGNTLLILVVVVLAALLGFWFYMNDGFKTLKSTPQESTMAPPVENKSDLDSASKDMDETDLNQLNVELELISSDSSSF